MILDRYIGRSLLKASFMALFTLLTIFSFFSLVEQLDDTGVGNYGVLAAMQYVLLTMPRLSYELFPVATVIGSMATLGLLANNNELVVIRTSGISQMQLAQSLLKTGLILIIINIFIGELIAPVAEQTAKQQRSIALSKQISLKTKHGLWLRDGNNYINIRKILPAYRVEHIYIYEFDDQNKLKSNTHVKYAEHKNDKWILHDILKTNISEEGISTETYDRADWQVLLNPQFIDLVTVKPRYLSLYGLVSYIQYLNNNDQDSRLYVQAFWFKLLNPFAVIAMILLAIAMVKCEAKPIGLGQRVFVGALIGIVFHVLNEVSGHLGIVYGIPVFISASLPTASVFVYVYYQLKKS